MRSRSASRDHMTSHSVTSKASHIQIIAFSKQTAFYTGARDRKAGSSAETMIFMPTIRMIEDDVSITTTHEVRESKSRVDYDKILVEIGCVSLSLRSKTNQLSSSSRSSMQGIRKHMLLMQLPHFLQIYLGAKLNFVGCIR